MERGPGSLQNLFKINGKHVIAYHSSLECPFCTILRINAKTHLHSLQFNRNTCVSCETNLRLKIWICAYAIGTNF